MAYWKKGKVFRKGRALVRYIYRNGRKNSKKLVKVKRHKSHWAGANKRGYRYKRKRY